MKKERKKERSEKKSTEEGKQYYIKKQNEINKML